MYHGRAREAKEKMRLCFVGFLFLTLAVVPARSVGQAVSEDPVVRYYWDKTGEGYRDRLDQQASRSYVLRARTYFHKVDRRGRITATDSTVCDYYYTGRRLDSQAVVISPRTKHDPVDLTIPGVFGGDYVVNAFPNDTGGSEMAIGFDTPTADDPSPTGLLIINRYRLLPRWLFVHYPDPGRGRRLSRAYRFAEREGIWYPDSVWEVGAKPGFLTKKYYRIETGVLSVRPLPDSAAP